MGQHLKVGILPNVPGSTASLRGLVDGIWGDMLTRELDFMDDVRYYPLKSWFTSDPTTVGLTSWEDGATTYRAWRDEYFKESNEYMLSRVQKQPYIYRRFARDPKPWANDWNGSNPIDWVRITSPNKDGEFCMPLPTFYGAENYVYYNPARPILHDYMRMHLRNLEDLAFAKSYQSGDPMFHLEEQGMVLDQDGNYIPADTMDARLSNYRTRRDAYIKLANEVALGHVPTEQEATQLVEDREFLDAFDFDANVPSMWSDEICRPVWSGEITTWEGSYFHDTTLTNHEPGTMPFEVLPGVTSLNVLPSVPNMNLLPATGNPGDVVCIQGDGDLMAWDPQNQEWSYGFFNRFLEFFFGSGMRATRDAKLKARNEMILALRPFNFAALYMPAFPITDDSGNIKSELL